MYIVMLASECAPVAKVGGLADVVFGLSRELEIRGNAVEIILPKYDCMRYDHIWGMQKEYGNLLVPWGNGMVACSVWFGFVHGRKCYFIEPHSQDNFFNRGTYYGCWDDSTRMAFFSKAALEFMLKANKRPEIIHCHDWQTGLAPVMLYELYQTNGLDRTRVCFTIHNFKHQGVAGLDLLAATGLGRPEYYFEPDRLRDDFNHDVINFMKGGIVYSNFIATVSPHHAWEARFTEQSCGLGRILHLHQDKFGGILNGIDYEVWNPEIDPSVPVKYSWKTLEGKYQNKDILHDRLLLRKDFKPLIAYIGRLDRQKGLDLIRHAIFYSIRNGAQFVLLGSSPDPEINNHFFELKNELNANPECHLEIGFNEDLAHLIYAGADMFLVPSLFEPCGLIQMMAMKYGAVPIVRSVGGLFDTVFDRDFSGKPLEERNGYVFQDYSRQAMEEALQRAIGLWYGYPGEFRKLVGNAMRCDYSWNRPGQHYMNVYEFIRGK